MQPSAGKWGLSHGHAEAYSTSRVCIAPVQLPGGHYDCLPAIMHVAWTKLPRPASGAPAKMQGAIKHACVQAWTRQLCKRDDRCVPHTAAVAMKL